MTEEERERQPNWNIEASQTLLDNWPLRDVLVALTHAATHLLTDHDCDAHGYEQLQHAVVAARHHADLLDSQAASSDLSHCALCEDPNFIYRDCVLAATTRMRDVCVDAIKSLRATPHGAAYSNAIDDAIRKVESLTLEEQPK